MIPLRVKYDDVHTKDFYVNNKLVRCVYDLGYCKYTQNPDLRKLKDGYYTYIIHDRHQLRVSPVAPFENGSKHIQLIQGAGISWTGGEFYKCGNEITYNLFAGLFRDVNPYNVKHHKQELVDMLHNTFKLCNPPNMKFVDYELIKDQEFISKGIWKIEHINQMYHTEDTMKFLPI